MDETKGLKSNNLQLNIAHVHGGMEPPEPGVASVFIDGTPLHAVHSIQIFAAIGTTTKCSIVFECEVSGKIGGKSVEEFIRESQG